MPSTDKDTGPAAILDPVPSTPSNDEIRKAQAIREALRRQLLGHAEPQLIACWVVGAD